MARQHAPREVGQHELRHESGEIIRVVERGRSFTIVRAGVPIGRLVPLRSHTVVPRAEVMATFAHAPLLDLERLRGDLDAVVDQAPFARPW